MKFSFIIKYFNEINLTKYLLLIIFILIYRNRNCQIQENKQTIDRILVVYVYGETHLFSRSNLEFFIHVGIKYNSHIDYYIIIQQIPSKPIDIKTLPKLPRNGRYIEHENKCFDIGTFGWFLLNNQINRTNYKYFIFLNSSCRGPYLVNYIAEWYEPFIKLLNKKTKLVGATISCQSTLHVQSYFWVLDFQGIEILLKDKTVFACHQTQTDAIYQGEIQASQILVQNNFQINCLMKKYQSIDLTKIKPKHCFHFNESNPFSQSDGIYLDPFEIIFIKYKSHKSFEYLQSRLSVYDQWISSK